jgi:phage terminase small subunit
MAGVKGKSGGPRPNSGGARPGAGRKARPPQEVALPELERQLDGDALPSAAKDFLVQVMLGRVVPSVPQLEAAKLLARLEAAPAGGKKQQQEEQAGKVASKFGARPAPLKLVNAK